MSKPILAIVRTQAHVALFRHYDNIDAMAASAFFDAFAPCSDSYNQALLQSASFLLQTSPKRIHQSKDFLDALMAILYGNSSPERILEKNTQSAQKLPPLLLTRLEKLDALDKELYKHQITLKPKAILTQLELLQQSAPIPSFLEKYSGIWCEHLIELSEIELACFFALSKLDFPILFKLPLDDTKRGISLASNALATRIETEHHLDNMALKLDNLSASSPFSFLADRLFAKNTDPEFTKDIQVLLEDKNRHLGVMQATSTRAEIRWICSEIKQILERTQTQNKPTIAIVIQAPSAFSKLLRAALQQEGLEVDAAKLDKLANTQAGHLLLLYLHAAQHHIALAELLGILQNPCSVHTISSNSFSQLHTYCTQNGILHNHLVATSQKSLYKDHLNFMQLSKVDRDFVEKCLNALNALSEENTLAGLIATLQHIVRTLFLPSRSDVAAILESLVALSKLKAQTKNADLYTFEAFIKQHCLEQTFSQTSLNPYIAMLSPQDIMGLHFDAVIIPNMVFGQYPYAAQSNQLLTDNDRFFINQLMRRPILRLYEPDILEDSPVPARLSLEPLYFLSCLQAAKSTLLFSCAKLDPQGKEQAQSAFFDDLLFVLGDSLAHFQGHMELYSHKKSSTPSSSASPHNEINASFIKEYMPQALGLLAEKPMTATRLEAYALCPFKAFIERCLHMKVEDPTGYDLEPRLLGQIAHSILESYYRQSSNATSQDRGFLDKLVEEKAQALLKGYKNLHPLLAELSIAWLKEALGRLISNLKQDLKAYVFSRRYCELAIGIEQEGKTSYSAVPLQIEGNTIYLGGLIDRVDEGPDARIVFDYKLSKSSTFSSKLTQKALCNSHFQLPLYLRLLEYHFPHSEGTKSGAALISIRDGSLSPIIGIDKFPDFHLRMMDDTREDGLAQGIKRSLEPFMRGNIYPKAGPHCLSCHLGPVCRVSSEALEPESEEGELAT